MAISKINYNSRELVTTPAFLARPTDTSSAISVDSYYTVLMATEVFDQNGDLASNTFTAPVTGKYQLNAAVFLYNLDAAAQYYFIQIHTSNRTYQCLMEPDTAGDASYDPPYWFLGMNQLCDMDASDTAVLRVYQSGGASQTTVIADSNGTWFSGFLVA